jgi:hypothetical protein
MINKFSFSIKRTSPFYFLLLPLSNSPFLFYLHPFSSSFSQPKQSESEIKRRVEREMETEERPGESERERERGQLVAGGSESGEPVRRADERRPGGWTGSTSKNPEGNPTVHGRLRGDFRPIIGG